MAKSSTLSVPQPTLTQSPPPAGESTGPIKVLLVEDNPGDAFLIQGMLGIANPAAMAAFHLNHVERLDAAIATLKTEAVAVVLLDLSLPDSEGLQALTTLAERAPNIPVVILTGLHDESLAVQAVQWGAQDYLIKDQVNRELLVHAIRYAIERQRTEEALKLRTLQLEMANQELNKQTLQLAAANADLEAFNYTISHDLRNPLAGIKTGCALLNAYLGNRDAKANRYLEKIQQYTQRMGDVFEGLLQLSQISHSPLQWQTLDLSTTAKMIATQLKLQSPKRTVDLIIAPNVEVEGDPRLLWMALEHLLSNAWKFCHHRKSRIEFGVCSLADVRAQAHLPPAPEAATLCASQPIYFVRDNGMGFDMVHLDKIFAPFHQLAEAQSYGGQGLGLAIVRCIINRHNGLLWATAAVGQGATLYWTLPGKAAECNLS